MRSKKPAMIRVRNTSYQIIQGAWPGAIFDLCAGEVARYVERGEVEVITDEANEDAATHPRWTIENSHTT